MRYIGNKTRLLPFLGAILDQHGVIAGSALDGFAGTASVGRHLKSLGFQVTGCDLMRYSYVLQRVYVQLDHLPTFDAIAAHLRAQHKSLPDGQEFNLAAVLQYLNELLPDKRSLISTEFSRENITNSTGRMYFTRDNAGKIDAVREVIDEWRASGLLSEDEWYVLLGALIEALDAVANTTGVYAAYIKSWQPNALRPLSLKPPALPQPQGQDGAPSRSVAVQGDINDLVRQSGPFDLVYLDPPYNSRQYSAYYHIPEVVANGWSDGWPKLRGKTGLAFDAELRSDWSRKAKCLAALSEFLEHCRGRYLLLSYNSEGIIPDEEIRIALTARAKAGSLHVHEQEYARYRSDSDGVGRRYKASHVRERAYFIELA